MATAALLGSALWLALAIQPAVAQTVGSDADREAVSKPPQQTGFGDLLKLVDGFLEQTGAPDADTTKVSATVFAQPYDSTSVKRDEAGLLSVHVRDLEIGAVLEMLSYEARANIVATHSVTGRVTANLYDVTLAQALDAILTPNQYFWTVSAGTIFVGTDKETALFRPAAETRVFPLKYIPAAEAAEAVLAVLGTNANVVQGGGNKKAGGSGADEMGTAGTDYLIVSDYPERLDTVAKVLQQIDQRPRQVLIEATILRATLNESNQFGIDFTMLGGVDFQNVNSISNPADTNVAVGPLPPDRLQNTTFNVTTDFTGGITGGGLTFGIIKDSIGAFIRALEETTDVVVVANPKIATLNKQEGEVIVGRRDGYLTTTVTETAAVQTVEFLETGTQIRFRPLINDDGTVRLAVHPKDSNGGLTAANLPFEETTEAHADILVDDGNTVLIGGLFRERTLNSQSQLPVLGDIPVAGLLFGSRDDQTVREEVIILLTVHVLKETEEEQSALRELVDDIERIRVGSRRGLVGTGRERLAQAYYHEAIKNLEAGNRQRALLNVRMTLNNQPKHFAALKLQEQLLGERLWDDDGTRMRTFIWNLIGDRDPPRPPVPPPVFHRPRVDPSGYLWPEDDEKGAQP